MELKPCPFCGEKDCYVNEQEEEIEDLDDNVQTVTFHTIYCPGCAGMFQWCIDRDATITQWNERPDNNANATDTKGAEKVCA